MYDVNRGEMSFDELLDGLADGRGDVGEHQRHRTFGTGDDGGRSAGAALEIVTEERDVAEGGGHQQKLCVR